jgi:transcriptional regulator of arginine metabolism
MVVHTPPGHASMVAYDIDNAHHPYFLGTVAGDDTVIVVLQEELERDVARDAIGEIVAQL